MTVSTGIFQPSNRQIAESLSRIHNGDNFEIGICENLASVKEAAEFIMWDTWAACELSESGEYATVLYLQDEAMAVDLQRYVFKTSTGQNLTLEVNMDRVLVLAYVVSP